MIVHLLHVADWLAWWGLVSLIAFFLFATFAHIVDLLFFPESDPEKPKGVMPSESTTMHLWPEDVRRSFLPGASAMIDPEKPRQSARLCGNRSGVPLQEGGVSTFASKGVMPSAMHLRHAERLLSRASEIAVSDGVTHPSENTFSKRATKGFDRRVS